MNHLGASNGTPVGNTTSQPAIMGENHVSGAPVAPAPHPPGAAPGPVFPVDPNAAFAMAAAAAAAVQQIAQQQRDTNQPGLVLTAGQPLPAHLKNQLATVPRTAPVAAPGIASHHPAPVVSASTQPAGPNNPAVQQSPLAMMAALFNGLGGAAASATHMAGHTAPHPTMQVAAHAPVAYQMPTPQAQAPTTMVAAPANHLTAVPSNPAAVAAAAAQVVAACSTNPAPSSNLTNVFLANIKSWKLDQLESHVQLLRDTSQPIPQPVALLLAEARRKEEKRTAKRVANRKSACTSRARKKALVEEMTRTNARLRRQALILALLPDLVIAITVDGEITFCSAQVERVLRHKENDLVGANISDILAPASKEALLHLIEELVAAERVAASAGDVPAAGSGTGAGTNERNTKESARAIFVNGNESGQSSAGEVSSGGAAVVSDQSFPLSVVKVENRTQQNSSGGDSDLSISNGSKPVRTASSITNNSMSRSTTNSSLSNQSDEAAAQASSSVKEDGNQEKSKKKTCPQPQTSSDDSLSSLSDSKNLRKANEALTQNVRSHNEKMLSNSKAGSSKCAHKDDVTGASVTANNADARLSSLQHHPNGDVSSPKKSKSVRYESLEEQSTASSSDSLLAGVEEGKKASAKHGIENSSEDSGYRESNDSQSSREDTSDSSTDKERAKPLAPTCNVCLIRDDLTTLWCEVTSSIRTRSVKETVDGTAPCPQIASGTEKAATSSDQSAPSSVKGSNGSKALQQPSADSAASQDVVKELLLCLRPIRDGEKVDEALRFVGPSTMNQQETHVRTEPEPGAVTGELNDRSSSASNSSSNDADSGSTKNAGDSQQKTRPPKKRPVQQGLSKVSSDSSTNVAKKSRLSSDTEKSVVESLILMSHNSTNA